MEPGAATPVPSPKLMPNSSRILPRLLLVLLCAGAALPARADGDVRFSATLSAAQRDSAGLSQLTADQLAVIDGLVRQDEAASKFKNNGVDHTRFTQRRTARERELAGLDRLTPAQQAQLDDLAARRIPGTEPSSVAAAVAAQASAPGVTPQTTVTPTKPDIHGEVSFTYGWGRGGNTMGGDVILTYTDPAGRYGIMAGYSEFRGPGLPLGFYPGYGPIRAYPGAVPRFP
jgi:hypothetical protein